MRSLQFYIFLVFACIAQLALLAQPVFADVIVRSDIQPETPLVGQQVILKVDVLSEKGWAKVSRFGDFEIPDSYVKLIDSQGVRLTETLDGKEVTGQQYEFFIYPQTDGEINIPVIPLEVTIQTYGSDAGTSVTNTEIPSKSFSARYPENMNSPEGVVSTSQLKVSQSWSADFSDNDNTEKYQVGDAIKRSIFMEAADIPGMAFSPLNFTSPDGVRIYQDQAEVDDIVVRGSLTGKRAEHVTYVFQAKGRVVIPDIEVQWWNIETGKAENIVLQGKQLEIQSAPAYSSAVSAGQLNIEQFSVFDIIKIIVILSVVSIILILFIPFILKKYWKWKAVQFETETAYFNRLIKAAKNSDVQAAFNLLMLWLDRINPEHKPALLDKFIEKYGDENLQKVIIEMHSLLITSGINPGMNSDTSFNSDRFIQYLSKARQRWLEIQSKTGLEQQLLPQLN